MVASHRRDPSELGEVGAFRGAFAFAAAAAPAGPSSEPARCSHVFSNPVGSATRRFCCEDVFICCERAGRSNQRVRAARRYQSLRGRRNLDPVDFVNGG